MLWALAVAVWLVAPLVCAVLIMRRRGTGLVVTLIMLAWATWQLLVHLGVLRVGEPIVWALAYVPVSATLLRRVG